MLSFPNNKQGKHEPIQPNHLKQLEADNIVAFVFFKFKIVDTFLDFLIKTGVFHFFKGKHHNHCL